MTNLSVSKLFVTDMDGTLLNDRKELPPDFSETVKAVEESGGVFAFASGRSYTGLSRLYGSYSDNFGYICDNGSMVVYKGEVLHKVTITKTDIEEIAKILKINPNLVIIYCGTRDNFVLHDAEMNEDQIRELVYYYEGYKEISDVQEIDDEIIKAAVLFLEGIEDNIYPSVHLNDSLDVLVTAYVWIDICKKGISKDNAFNILRETLGVTLENSHVFGDYYNDLSMAEYATNTYAMQNAVPEVKDAFTFEIGSNEEGSVTKTIQSLINQKEV